MTTARMLTALLVTVVVCVCATPAQAANLTRSQMFAKAAGQAAFGCFVHDCSGRKALSVAPPYQNAIVYKFRLYGMHGVRGHAYYARCDRVIKVTFQGGLSYSGYYNCA